MRIAQTTCIVGLLLFGFVRTTVAEALPSEKLRQQQRIQRQVHDMAERLAADVLDLHLQRAAQVITSRNDAIAHAASKRQ